MSLVSLYGCSNASVQDGQAASQSGIQAHSVQHQTGAQTKSASKEPVVVVKTVGHLPVGVVGNALFTDSSGNLFSAGGYTGTYSLHSAYQVTPSTVHYLLPEKTHDAGAGIIGQDLFVLGGGQAESTNTIIRIHHGQAALFGTLSRPISDAVCVPYGNGLLMVGGYDGTTYNQEARYYYLRNHALVSDAKFTMGQPVRYPGVAISGGTVYIMGGKTSNGLVSGIYAWSAGMSKAKHIGDMPFGIEKAALFVDGTNLIIAGGMKADGIPMQTIWAFNMRTGRVSQVGKLPTPLADMGYTQFGSTGYVAGGMKSSNEANTSTTVYRLDLR